MLKRDTDESSKPISADSASKSRAGHTSPSIPPSGMPEPSQQPSSTPSSGPTAPANGTINTLGAAQAIVTSAKPKSTTDPAPTALRIPAEPTADNVKHAMTNINKSLKAKQRVINSREPLPKNASKILEFINKSPVNPNFPAALETEPTGERTVTSGPSTTPGTPLEGPKNKHRPKKNATKTDFFAAKLASAVDDVDSSDSDETFVYENNPNDVDTAAEPPNIHAPPATHISALQASPLALDPSASPTAFAIQPPAGPSSRAESIHSMSSRAPRPAKSQATPGAVSVSSVGYFDLNSKRPPHHRTVSGYSTSNQSAVPVTAADDKNQQGGHLTSTNSIDQASQYSFDAVDVDGDIMDDDDSTEGEFFLNTNLESSQTTVGATNNGRSDGRVNPSAATTSVGSKAASKKHCKSSVSSSKLRSTTSKLFNKKGTQPRRYSIIPDDVDIEDFDDDLIYYDGSIRFPYGNTQSNTYSVNESTSLLNAPRGKIPHYRSLNLYPSAQKRANDKRMNKRYLSTGQPLTPSATESKRDMFPFAYSDHQNYYYGYDDVENGDSDPERDIGTRRISNQLSPLSPKNGRYPEDFSIDTAARNGLYFWRSLFYTLLSIFGILSVGFIMGFVLASTKDLTNAKLDQISHALVSKDELVFDIQVSAFNPGWFTVEISEVELDVFAKSGYLEDELTNGWLESSSVETVLLGTVNNLDPPMIFSGGIFTRTPIEQSGEIRLLTPGKNLTGIASGDNSTAPDNSKKWEVISKNPFDLIVRGTLKYKLPLSSDARSVVVNKAAFVDPTLSSEV